jgi:FtsP/CotA-like multicopper oxidase with cupredoxin domain
MQRLGALAMGALLLSCKTSAPPPPPSDNPGISVAHNDSADPNVVSLVLDAREADVEIRPGVSTHVWTYNGTVPGPLIDASVGQTLKVHFTNHLPEPTLVHWHGLRLPNAMDGSPLVQTPVPPGGSFDYVFTLRDAGLFWFHPHVRSDIQTRRGLYGVIRVRAASEPASDHEHVLVLDDARLGLDGKLPSDLDDPESLSMDMKTHGRSGPDILVNGATNRTLAFETGALHRFRILNVAAVRVFNLTIPGHVFRVIGSDGAFFAHPYDTPNLIVGPAERYDAMLIAAGNVGDRITLHSDAYRRADDDPQAATDVATLSVTSAHTTALTLPSDLSALAPARLAAAGGAPINLTFLAGTVGGPEGYMMPMGDDAGMLMQPTAMGDPIFVINGKAASDIPPIHIAKGASQSFRIFNNSHQLHVFHLHGFPFQVLDSNDLYDPSIEPFGFSPAFLAQSTKDTLILRSGYATTIVAQFEEVGRWMYHCHIPEHAEHGMMAELDVDP